MLYFCLGKTEFDRSLFLGKKIKISMLYFWLGKTEFDTYVCCSSSSKQTQLR